MSVENFFKANGQEVTKTLGKTKEFSWYSEALKVIHSNSQASNQFISKLSEILGKNNAVQQNNVSSLSNKFRGVLFFSL